jgi:flagellar hook protein FlgE
LFTSFSTALSALSAHSTAVDVVGNNLANLNTAGFKSSSVAFSELVSQVFSAGLGQTQIGLGVARPTTIRQFEQGAIQASSGPLDAAIQGDGFLVVKDSLGRSLYTRGGNLLVDKAGNLVTATGEKVQGWTGQAGALSTIGPVGDIVIPVGNLKPAVATKTLSLDMNLDASATAAGTTGKFSTAIEVFDSLGASHTVTVLMKKSATANQWDYSVSVPDSDVSTPFTPVTGSITFDSSGKMIAPAANGTMPAIAITGLKSGAADLSMTWNMYDGTTNRLTQYAQPSSLSANSQDGSQAAQLVKVGLVDGGKILAEYSNGQQTIVGQLGMVAVRNPESLISTGNNNYQVSARTASPAIGVPGTGGRGNIIGGAVENSTVDIAKEFTNLIVYQRGYQANAKVITAVDELSQDTINLKR